MTRRPPSPPLALAVAAGLVFVLLPVAGLATRAWGPGLLAQATSPIVFDALRISLVVATSAVALCALLGFPLAWALARSSVPARILRSVVVLPLVLPPVVGGLGLLAAFGRRGLLGGAMARLGVELPFTTAAAVLAGAFVAFPLFVLALEAGLRALDPRLEDAAQAMGASRWYTLRRVVLPLLGPALSSGLILAWARALGEFGATIMFAGNLRGRTQTLPLAAFEVAQNDPTAGIAIGLLLVGVTLVALVALRGRVLP